MLTVPELDGIPEITPVVVLRLKPVGRPVADQVYAVVPPAATRAGAVYAVFICATGSVVVVMLSSDRIASVRSLLTVRCVGPVESVAVTVTVLVPAAVGVPEIAPVVALIPRPAGRLVADQVNGAVPPVPATAAV